MENRLVWAGSPRVRATSDAVENDEPGSCPTRQRNFTEQPELRVPPLPHLLHSPRPEKEKQPALLLERLSRSEENVTQRCDRSHRDHANGSVPDQVLRPIDPLPEDFDPVETQLLDDRSEKDTLAERRLEERGREVTPQALDRQGRVSVSRSDVDVSTRPIADLAGRHDGLENVPIHQRLQIPDRREARRAAPTDQQGQVESE